MIYYVSADFPQQGDGTSSRPFRTITEAAKLAVAGDEVLVSPGVYHEWVNPVHGGESDEKRITYRSTEKGGAIITGAETIAAWMPYEGDTWRAQIPNGVFGDYNPFATRVKGDWYNDEQPVHTGEVYLNGKSLYEVFSLADVLKAEPSPYSWDTAFSARHWFAEVTDTDTVIYANFGGADPNVETVEINVRRNCFYPDRTGVNYITLSGFSIQKAACQWAPPTAYQEGMVGPHWSKGWIIEDCEIAHAKCAGISLGKYLQPNNENKWTRQLLKDGTQNERDAICQAQYEGWTKENIGGHIIRRCDIHDCGQTGIVGHLGCVFSIIEDNHIHHINNKQELTGAEIGGIKLHAAIDVTIRRNHFHHCTRGLWLDWQAQGTRVTGNAFHDNHPLPGITVRGGLAFGEDIFIEVSHGPTLIDHNLLLSACSARVSTQGVAFVHNLIGGSFTFVSNGTVNAKGRLDSVRYTPYHVPHHTEVAGFMTILHGDMRFYNNIFAQQPLLPDWTDYAASAGTNDIGHLYLRCGTKPYDGYPTEAMWRAGFTEKSTVGHDHRAVYYDHLPVWSAGNVYLGGAEPWDKERDFTADDRPVSVTVTEEEGAYILRTDLYNELTCPATGIVSTQTMGMAFEPEECFEQPDGTPILMDQDYWGDHRAVNPTPGPFENGVPAEGLRIG